MRIRRAARPRDPLWSQKIKAACSIGRWQTACNLSNNPDGTVYAPVKPGSTPEYFSDAIYGCTRGEGGCIGWAAMCSDLIFGQYSNNKSHVLEDHSKIRPGDIIEWRDATTHKTFHHVIVVSKYSAVSATWNGGTIHGIYVSDASAGENTVYWVKNGMFEAWDNANGTEWIVHTRCPD